MTEEQRKAAKTASQKKWYEKNKNRHIQNVSLRKKQVIQRVRQFVAELKESTPCTDCGINYPSYVMDFDHLANKEYQISNMIHSGYDICSVQKEIDKCEIVCSNCHRVRTHNRLNDSVAEWQSQETLNLSDKYPSWVRIPPESHDK